MPKGYFTPYTAEQEAYIKQEYLNKPIKTIAQDTGSTFQRVMRFLKKNDLEVPRELIEKRKLLGRIKKGSVPPNKGMKPEEYMSSESHERMKATQFKAGHKPHNTKEEKRGVIVSRKDKNGMYYKFIKISDGDWRLYHRMLWEETNGKIPEGHLLVFKDGDTNNVVLENLELITKTENMYRNSKHDYPKEIIPSLVLSKKLENRINDLKND